MYIINVQMLHPPLSAFSFLFIFEYFSEQNFGIKRVEKGQMTNIKIFSSWHFEHWPISFVIIFLGTNLTLIYSFETKFFWETELKSCNQVVIMFHK